MAFARPLGQASAPQRRGGYDSTINMNPQGSGRTGGKAGDAVTSLVGKGGDFVPEALALPRVCTEVSVKVARPLPPLFDDSAEDEITENLLDVVRGGRYYQMERDVDARGRGGTGHGSRRFDETLEAVCSDGYRDWSEGLTDLHRGLLHNDVAYFMAVHRQGHHAVWVFTNQRHRDYLEHDGRGGDADMDDDDHDLYTASVTAAAEVLEALNTAATYARVPCRRRGPHTLLLSGFQGVGVAMSVLQAQTTPQLLAKLPLLLSPASFLGAVSKLPNPRTMTEQTSLFAPPSHYLKLSGRVLPHTVAGLFAACRALGPFEMDLTPTKATSIWCYAQAVPVPWPGGPVWPDPAAAAGANTVALSSDDSDMEDDETQPQQAAGGGGGEAVCPTRVVVTQTEVRVSGVPVERPT